MNTKQELLETIVLSGSGIKCAHVTLKRGDLEVTEILKTNHTERELSRFLQFIDIVYSEKSGLTGTIWLKDNSWIERNEKYQIGEWEHHILPNIPESCK